MPTRPAALSLSADSLVIPTFGPGAGGQATFDLLNTRLIAGWQNPTRDLFYVTIESTDPAPTEIQVGGADSFAVAPFTLAYYGSHQIRVYHVNTEYAALYESRMQDSRDLNEPATNIKNGLVVFSASSSRTAAFRAVAQK